MISSPDVHDAPPPRHRAWRRLLLAAALAGLALTATLITIQNSADTSPTALRRGDGKQAPAFQLPDLRNPQHTIELADFSGRLVVLNFWASWCVPCRREMAAFQALHDQLGDQVAFVGIDHQDGRSPALDLLTETGVTYPTAHDPAGDVAQAYGLYGMPTTVFISSTGERLATRTGEIRADELERTIRQLLLDR